MQVLNKRFWLVCIALLYFLAGCGTGKKEAPPDPFEKWRVMAEETKDVKDPGPGPEIEKGPDVQAGASLEKQQAVTAPVGKEPEPAPRGSENKLPDRPVSLKMMDVSLQVLLRVLARTGNVNILMSDNIQGTTTVSIDNMAWDLAFISILNTHGLDYLFDGNALRVISKEDIDRETAMLEARQNYEIRKKEHNLSLASLKKQTKRLEELETKVIRIKYADVNSLRNILEQYLSSGNADTENRDGAAETDQSAQKELSGLKGLILADANTNSLIIHATQTDMDKILPIIGELDRPTPQVRIEAHIVEANSDTARELGIQWGGLLLKSYSDENLWVGGPMGEWDSSLLTSDDDDSDADAGTPIQHLMPIGNIMNFPTDSSLEDGKGMSLGLMFETFGKNILTAQLTALQEDGKLNILSNPSITTMDNQAATIESGSEVPFQTVEDDEVQIIFKKAVINLKVTPHVIDDRSLKLEIVTHKDELDWSNTINGYPTIITKNAQTIVSLFNGQTTVIGGLTKELVSKGQSGVPWLKDVPGLGYLFRTDSNSEDMEELLIFITPHILGNPK